MDDEIDDMNRDVQGASWSRVMQQHPLVSGQALNAIIIIAKPGTGSRPRDEYCRGCDLLDSVARMCGISFLSLRRIDLGPLGWRIGRRIRIRILTFGHDATTL